MPKIELTDADVRAIDLACMYLLENVRRGRQFQAESLAAGEPDVAEWYGESIRRASEAGVTLRGLLTRYKDTDDAND